MSTPDEGALKPIGEASRINSLDFVRGVALLGILLMNINGMGLPYSYEDPSILGHDTGWNLRIWIVNELLFEGTMRGLFSMLFGAGIILLTTRQEASGAGIRCADIYYRRTLWLLAFGLGHSWVLLWFGDILYPYALFGLMLFPLRNCRPRYLLLAGLVLLCGATFLHYRGYEKAYELESAGLEAKSMTASGEALSSEQSESLEAYEKALRKQTPEELEKAIASRNSDYISVLKSYSALIRMFQTTMVYDKWVWDILSVMLIGMAFFKWGIFSGERSSRFYWLCLIVGYAVGLSVNAFEVAQRISSEFDPTVMARMKISYDLGRMAMTIGHIGLLLLIAKSGILAFMQRALAAVGRMALTNYLMHSVVAGIVFYGYGFGLYGRLERFELLYIVIGIWIFQLIASPIWLDSFRYGPAEWLWRSLTYMKLQPFRKRN